MEHGPEPGVAAGLVWLARHRAAMSQRELALAAGTTQATIGAIERGRREPSIPMLLKILRGAGFDLRLHLVAHDEHDEALAFEESQRSRRDQRAWRASQRRLVAEGRRQLAAR